MRFRLPSFRPDIHTGLGYGVSDVGKACVNRTFGCITTIIILAVIIFLFYKNPPWLQQVRDNFLNFFQRR